MSLPPKVAEGLDHIGSTQHMSHRQNHMAWCHRKVDVCELKASMVYIVRFKPAGLYSETLSQDPKTIR